MKIDSLSSILTITIINTLISLANIGVSFYKEEIISQQIQKHSIHPLYGTYEQKVFGCPPWDSCRPKNN